jgi:hypothetical protein
VKQEEKEDEMRTYPLRTLVGLVAVMMMLLTNVAVAQDEVEIPQTQEACEASGRFWAPENMYDMGYPGFCVANWPDEDWTLEEAFAGVAERAPAESAPSAPLPQSLPATAQPGAPQYTG